MFDLIKHLNENNINYTVSDIGNITVFDNLNLRNRGVDALPDNLTVGGDLRISDTPITTLPESLMAVTVLW